MDKPIPVSESKEEVMFINVYFSLQISFQQFKGGWEGKFKRVSSYTLKRILPT